MTMAAMLEMAFVLFFVDYPTRQCLQRAGADVSRKPMVFGANIRIS
jgi:hypothetical protein